MASQSSSRWADNEVDLVHEAQRKKEKDAKKAAKLERQQRLEQEQKKHEQRQQQLQQEQSGFAPDDQAYNGGSPRPQKRRKLSVEREASIDKPETIRLLRFPAPEWGPCRHVDNFEKLNHIEEGSYGWVSRAKETATGEVVALKKLKMEYSNDGFPVTGLREIQTLMASRHSNIVGLREVVMGDKLDE